MTSPVHSLQAKAAFVMVKRNFPAERIIKQRAFRRSPFAKSRDLGETHPPANNIATAKAETSCMLVPASLIYSPFDSPGSQPVFLWSEFSIRLTAPPILNQKATKRIIANWCAPSHPICKTQRSDPTTT